MSNTVSWTVSWTVDMDSGQEACSVAGWFAGRAVTETVVSGGQRALGGPRCTASGGQACVIPVMLRPRVLPAGTRCTGAGARWSPDTVSPDVYRRALLVTGPLCSGQGFCFHVARLSASAVTSRTKMTTHEPCMPLPVRCPVPATECCLVPSRAQSPHTANVFVDTDNGMIAYEDRYTKQTMQPPDVRLS